MGFSEGNPRLDSASEAAAMVKATDICEPNRILKDIGSGRLQKMDSRGRNAFLTRRTVRNTTGLSILGSLT